MEDTKWTKDQLEAITARESNLLLSAAAGSGKTTVLVARVLSLIEEGADIEHMLIITFTRAAASSMRSKLTQKVSEYVKDHPDKAMQLEKIERAHICTIHSYCSDFLRNHFEAAGIDPAFRIFDEAEDNLISAKALDDTLEAALKEKQDDPDMQSLLYGQDADTLRSLVKRVYTFSRERPEPDKWLDQALLVMPEGDGRPWFDAIVQDVRRKCTTLAAEYQNAMELAEVFIPRYLPVLNKDLSVIENIASSSEYAALLENLSTVSFAKMPSVSNKDIAAAPDPDAMAIAKKQISDSRDKLKKSCKDLSESLIPTDLAQEDYHAQAASLRALRYLVGEYAKTLWQYKLDRSGLTYSDLEQCTLRTLDNHQIAAAEQERFTHVFVDEYQDVSHLQEAIIRKISRPDNLFMVGDVKQSIYRFRQAQPGLFIDKYEQYSKGTGGRLINLSQNFRSRNNILEQVNTVFSHAMSGSYAEIQYDENAFLHPGAAYPDADPPVEIYLVSSAEEDILSPEETSEGDTSDAENANAAGCTNRAANADTAENIDDEDEANTATLIDYEANCVAEQIRRLVGTPCCEEDTVRPMRYSDIVILARTNSVLRQLEQSLLCNGIPCYLDASSGYLGALEVQEMLSLLQTIVNQKRDLPLLSVLRSPIVGLTSTQLAMIRAAHTEGPFHEAVAFYREKSSELSSRLRALDAQLQRWRLLSLSMPVVQLIDLIMTESGYYTYVGGMPNGSVRQGNLDLLCIYAGRYELTQNGGLPGFIRYMEDARNKIIGDSDMDSAHTLGEGDNVVRLMTIHKSKGLEFPVVIGVALEKKLRAPNVGQISLHQDLGFGMPYIDPSLHTSRKTICCNAIEAKKRAESLEEEKRLLYVLMTRAKERLILVGGISGKNTIEQLEKKQTFWKAASNPDVLPSCYLDMIMPCYQENTPQGVRIFYPDDLLYPSDTGEAGEQASDQTTEQSAQKAAQAATQAATGDTSPQQLSQQHLQQDPLQHPQHNPLQLAPSGAAFDASSAFGNGEKSSFRVDAVSGNTGTGMNKDSFVYSLEPLLQDSDPFRDALVWKYPYIEQVTAPVRISVSALTRHIIGPTRISKIAQRPRFLAEDSLTASERGTLIHAALNTLDLTRLRHAPDLDAEIRQQLEDLYERNLLYQRVPSAPLCAFFHRPIGQQILHASVLRREWAFSVHMTTQELKAQSIENIGTDIIVEGVIDMCFLDEDGSWILLDYKTDYVQKSDLEAFLANPDPTYHDKAHRDYRDNRDNRDKDLEKPNSDSDSFFSTGEFDEEDNLDPEEVGLLRKYAQQVSLYRMALERATGIPVKTTLLCLLSMHREISI